MSRLDYITIGIVAACIIAIVFLVYKMTNLFDDGPVVDPIESPSTPIEVEDTSTYQNTTEDLNNGEASTDDESNTNEATTSADPNENTDNGEEDVQDPPVETKPAPVYSKGKFMVIAGTFSKSVLAKSQVSKLKNLGFNNARIEPFDRGKYDVVMVDRFDNMADAERLVKSLKSKGVDCYVKTKEAQ